MRRKKSSGGGRPRSGSVHRRVLPGSTYLLTKKCSDDQLLIVPSRLVNQVLLYLLLLKAKRYGVIIHGFCFMSNHFHLIATDARGCLPDFMREFLGESSKAVQAVTSVDRPVWSRKRYSAVLLLDLEAAERKNAYAGSNPVRPGLTLPADWPGLTSARYSPGQTIRADRPDAYFSERRPKSVSTVLEPLTVAFDDGVASETERKRLDAASNRRVELLIETSVSESLRKLERSGRKLLGPEKALRATQDQRGRRRVRHLNPRFASRNRALMSTAIAQSRQFEIEHENAKRRYLAGEKNVRFPAGTFGYRRLLGVRVQQHEEAA